MKGSQPSLKIHSVSQLIESKGYWDIASNLSFLFLFNRCWNGLSGNKEKPDSEIPNPSVLEETDEGWVLCGTSPAPTHRLSRKVSKTRPAHFRAAAVLPRPPHPTSCKSLSQQAPKIRRPSWDKGRKKVPSSCRLIGVRKGRGFQVQK